MQTRNIKANGLTSNDFIAKDGREWFIFEKNKKVFQGTA